VNVCLHLCQKDNHQAEKEIFEDLMREEIEDNRIPVEWVIDIADEANGWF
jgi:hypothetical protein